MEKKKATAKKKVSVDTSTPPPPKEEIDYPLAAFRSCSKINTQQLADTFGIILSKSIPELANMTGNASTIMLAQTILYIKRNNPSLIEDLKRDLTAIDSAKTLFSQVKVQNKKQKSKDVW